MDTPYAKLTVEQYYQLREAISKGVATIHAWHLMNDGEQGTPPAKAYECTDSAGCQELNAARELMIRLAQEAREAERAELSKYYADSGTGTELGDGPMAAAFEQTRATERAKWPLEKMTKWPGAQ